MPTAPRPSMLDALSKFLEPFYGRPKVRLDHPTARFGHIRIPPYRPDEVSIMETIRQMFQNAGDSGRLFFVTSAMEMAIGLGVKMDDDVPPETLTHAWLLTCLRANYNPEGIDDEWKRSSQPEGWMNRQILPRNIVLVLQIDQTLSADCALCLIGIVQWALSVSYMMSTSIRVLTMSAERDSNFLSKLVSLAVPDVEVSQLDLAALCDQDPTRVAFLFNPCDIPEIAQEIVKTIRKDPDRSRLIISFDPSLEDEMSKLLHESEDLYEVRMVYSDSNPGFLNQLNAPRTGPRAVLVVLSGDALMVPMDLTGIGAVHVVPNLSGAPTSMWDNESGQVVSRNRKVSLDEHYSQLWWARQPSIHRRYLYPGNKSFHEQGYRQIENAQLGGFIAAVVDLQCWKINVEGILEYFIRAPARVKEMMFRLKTQRLITSNGLALSEAEASIFRAALSAVKYDHRLALLVAIESDPSVRRVKAQLAAINTVGQHMVAHLCKEDLRTKSPILLKRVFDNCWGLGRSLATQGSLFLVLGLYKNHRKVADENQQYLSSQDKLDGVVITSQEFIQQLHLISTTLLVIMKQKGAIVDDSQSVLGETNDLSPDLQVQLQSHLFRAYMHQLTASYYSVADDDHVARNGLVHKFISTMSQAQPNLSPHLPASLINMVSILREEDDCIFGIAHSLYRLGDDPIVYSRDWTLIPGDIIAQWQRGIAPGRNICSILNSGVQL